MDEMIHLNVGALTRLTYAAVVRLCARRRHRHQHRIDRGDRARKAQQGLRLRQHAARCPPGSRVLSWFPDTTSGVGNCPGMTSIWRQPVLLPGPRGTTWR
jgi:hypothetical protein